MTKREHYNAGTTNALEVYMDLCRFGTALYKTVIAMAEKEGIEKSKVIARSPIELSKLMSLTADLFLDEEHKEVKKPTDKEMKKKLFDLLFGEDEEDEEFQTFKS